VYSQSLTLDKNSREYQRALASSRQQACIHKAVALQKGGEPVKALTEISKALTDNSICRCPLNDGHHSKEELQDLYKLHLRYGDVPPNYAILLQLQEMLTLSQDEAESIELEVLQAPNAFSI
jgi:hypothetical protein